MRFHTKQVDSLNVKII